MLGKDGTTQMLKPWQVVLICLAFIIAVIIAAAIKKVYYRKKLKKKFYILPRLSNKGIAYIAMAISIAVATILILAFLTAGILAVIFRAYPGWRITIEGILIKIGGLFFGPIIGIFIGMMTDILTVLLSAGAFHYGYFIVAIMYGFIGGLIRWLWNSTKKDNVKFTFIITLIWIAVAALIGLYIHFIPSSVFMINILNKQIKLTKLALGLMIGGVFAAGLLMLWICMASHSKYSLKIMFINLGLSLRYGINPKTGHRNMYYKSNRQSFADKHLKWFAKNCTEINQKKQRIEKLRAKKAEYEKINWVSYMLPVLGLIIVCEPIVQSVILPNFDIEFSTNGFEYWMALRTVNLMWLTPLNIAIIFGVYKLVSPSIRYDYQDDTITELEVNTRKRKGK